MYTIYLIKIIWHALIFIALNSTTKDIANHFYPIHPRTEIRTKSNRELLVKLYNLWSECILEKVK